MNRKLMMLRLMLCKSGYARAAYLKKKRYFHHQGEHCFLTPYNYGTEPYLISMGDNVYVASGVTFVNHDISGYMFRRIDPEAKHMKRVGTIQIGSNVFIGAGATILYDVKIGSNVIIAAGALVNHDVPDNTIYGGVPAKKIGNFADYLEKSRVYSTNVQWSDLDTPEERKKRQIEQCWHQEAR